MIDLHTHILPGIDDGPPDLETAVAMARYGQENGLTAVAATPHIDALADWGTIKTRVEELQGELAKENIELNIISGAELFVDVALLDMEVDQIPTYGDRGEYCLLELPMYQTPVYTDQVIFSLQTKGITPIIAHPERYSAVIDDPNLVLEWLEAGCLIQMNSGSILGRFGAKIKETAEIMLSHNMVQLVASDSHGLERRSLNLKETYNELVEIVGPEQARALVETNPKAMLAGEFSLSQYPRPYVKTRRYLFF